jgi:hypothetical protein
MISIKLLGGKTVEVVTSHIAAFQVKIEGSDRLPDYLYSILISGVWFTVASVGEYNRIKLIVVLRQHA